MMSSTSKTSYETSLLNAMRQTLISVAKDTMTKPGLKHPLTAKTQGMITDCLEVISQRQVEIEKSSGKHTPMRPVYTDEQNVQTISADNIKIIKH